MCIGTGLGRDLRLIDEMPALLESMNKKLSVGDADFFWYLIQDLHANLKIMKNGKGWIFTPNKREFIKIFTSYCLIPFIP